MRRMRIATVATGVLAATLLGSAVAQADPTTSPRPINAVGSDTTQDVWNGLSTLDTNVASWNAFLTGSTTVQLDATTTINRPAGSGAGVIALSASADPTWTTGYPGPSGNVNVQGKIQFARSSSGAAKNGTDLTYLPFARDAVSVAVKTTAGTVNLTTQQVKDIYSCSLTSLTIGSTTIPLQPKLPQASSGTRSFFLSVVGNPGTCVTTVGAENDGSQLVNTGDVIPFSAAQWIAQKNGVTANTVATGIELAQIDSKSPYQARTGGGIEPNANFYGSASAAPTAGGFARDTYNVVRTSDYTASTSLVTGTLKSNLKTLGATNAIKNYGFLPLTYVGDPTVGGTVGLTTNQAAYKHS